MGAGSTFELQSLTGEVDWKAPTQAVGKLLGVPEGLAWLLGPNLDLHLTLGGEGATTENIPFHLVASGKLDHYGSLHGTFDGSHWELQPTDVEGLQNPREVGGASPRDGFFQRMGSHEGLRSWLRSLSLALPQPPEPIGVFTEANDQSNWDLYIGSFRSGVGTPRRDLPLLEGWLAACAFEVQVVSMAQVSLKAAAADGGVLAGAQGLNLDQATLDWSYSPIEGVGRGELSTAASADRVNNINTVLTSLSMTTGDTSALIPTLELKWFGRSPFPIVQPEIQSVVLSNTLTSFFQGYMPSWAVTATHMLGKACTLRLEAGLYPGPDGVETNAWKLGLEGTRPLGVPLIPLYLDRERLWSEPSVPGMLELDPITPGGAYERFFARFLPWLAKIRIPSGTRDGWLVEFRDLLVEPGNSGWNITGGSFVFSELTDDVYTLNRDWSEAWGADANTVHEIALRVDRGRVYFDELEFPVGTLAGSIDLDADMVSLKLEELNPVLKSLPSFLGGEAVSMAPGNMLQGSIARPSWLKPVSAPRSATNE